MKDKTLYLNSSFETKAAKKGSKSLKIAGYANTISKDRAGNPKYDEPAFMFSKTAVNKKTGEPNKAPKLIDADGNPLDCLIGNGSNVTVKVRPYNSPYGTFAELIAVKVNELVEYEGGDSDNEEF